MADSIVAVIAERAFYRGAIGEVTLWISPDTEEKDNHVLRIFWVVSTVVIL